MALKSPCIRLRISTFVCLKHDTSQAKVPRKTQFPESCSFFPVARLPCSKCLKRFCLSRPFPVFKERQGQKEIAASLASSKHVIFLCLSCVDNPAPPPAPVDLAGVEKRIADLTKSVEELKAITPFQIPVQEDDEENDEDLETPAALFTEVVSGKK